MRKTLEYSSFAVIGLIMVMIFVTARTYTQLGAAVVLYPLVAYFAYKLFVSRDRKVPVTIIQPSVRSIEEVTTERVQSQKEGTGVTDVDKRDFLKMIGAAGVSFLLFSIFSRRPESLFFGSSKGSGITALTDGTGTKIDPAERQLTDGYQISEIDDNIVAFYGFTNREGAWFIMKEDPDEGSFRYIKGDSDFSGNWVNHENLRYDYYHNVF